MRLFLILILICTNIIISQDSLQYEKLQFYPLHIGNVFQYQHNKSSIIKTVIVSKDTLLENNFLYKCLITSYSSSDQKSKNYERIDSSEGIVYRYYNTETLNSNEYKIDNLLAEVGDTSETGRYTDGRYIDKFKTFCNGLGPINMFGQQILIKHYQDASFDSDGINYSYQLAQGFGLYKSSSTNIMTGTSTYTLVYAKVNNKEFGSAVSLKDNRTKVIPPSFKLYQNFPNPFNPITTIKYSVPNLSTISLKIFDTLGENIITLVNEQKPFGKYEIEFNASNLPSGIYFYRLESGNFSETKKLVLIQ